MSECLGIIPSVPLQAAILRAMPAEACSRESMCSFCPPVDFRTEAHTDLSLKTLTDGSSFLSGQYPEGLWLAPLSGALILVSGLNGSGGTSLV